MRAKAIEVHIEELVLEGVSAADRLSVGAAIERELGRLFAEHGVPERLTAGPPRQAVDGGSFERGSGASPARIGDQVAVAVYRGLGR
jgi:hypothetical protein